MTFTILGRCPHSGQLGGAVASSDIAVGARVLFAEPGLAVAATQHSTDPRLGPAILGAMRGGQPVAGAVATVAAGTPHRDWRQLGAVDAGGRSAAFTGALVWPVAAQSPGADCLALGNMLTGDEVGPAMAAAFDAAPDDLAGRLLAALRTGLTAGGETGRLRSAALLVVEHESFPLVDLRIDDGAQPLSELETLWAAYRPLVRTVLQRALDPETVHRSSTTTTEPPSRRAG